MTTVAPAGIDDLDDVAQLFGAYLEFYGVKRDPADARRFLRDRIEAGDSLILLARTADGVPAGLAQVYFTFSSLSLARVWTFNDLYVDPAARGLGVGRTLVRDVCRRAVEAGALRVQGETAVDNHTAQALYATEGFEEEHGFLHLSRAAVRGV